MTRFPAPLRAPLRHRRVLAGLGVLAALLLALASPAEARGAPSWLSRWVRVMTGRDEPMAVAGDTVVVFGPKTLSLGTATSGTFVERFTVSGSLAAGSGYVLRLTNGVDGSAAVSGGTVRLNGATVATSTDLAATGSGATLDIPVQLLPTDTLVASLTGPAGAALGVTVIAAPDPTFAVFGPKTYERASGAPVLITEHFSLPAGASGPFYMCVRNGEPDGTRRVSSATVRINGVDVVTQSELNQQVAGFRKKVVLQRDNVLEVQLNTDPGVRLTLCMTATDSAPPAISVTAPLPGAITRATTIDATGVVEDQTAVRITVNGAPASVSSGTPGRTSFTASVALPLEGANRIAISAVDAAGNRADSVRTVIRDTQAPVVTLNALPDTTTYSADSALVVSGTITDRTAITANVNGIPLVIDSVTHAFTQRVTLAQGPNFISITATDAAGNATSLMRQVTRDDVPPTLTVTAPAEGAVTREVTAHVTGTATAHSPLTVTVNGTATAVAADGAFTADVPLAEGENAITVVATNAAGVATTMTRHVTRDTEPPALSWAAPSDHALTSAASAPVTGTVTDRTAITLTLNGTAVSVATGTGDFASAVPLTADGDATLTLVATDAAGNSSTRTRTITRDATPPVITVSAPAAGTVTSAATVHVTGSVADLTASTLTVNGASLALAADGSFAGDVPLVAGANTLAFTATDAAGNHASVERAIVRDSDAPVVTMASPGDNLLVRTGTVTVRGTVTDASVVTATLNGTPLVLATDGSYASAIALSEGTNLLTVVATDAAGNATTTSRTITLDTTAPALALASPADGATTEDETVAVSGTATDVNAVRVTVNGTEVGLSSGGAFSTTLPLEVGPNAITVVATDSAGNAATATRSVTRQDLTDPTLPPNPARIAPALDRTVMTSQVAATAFLYTGSNPVQVGVAPGAIVATRAATLRGRVITTAGAALSGALVTIKGHPELGSTKSRTDGWYDMEVNGGGLLTVDFVKEGHLPAQRTMAVRAQDYTVLDDVALVKLDPIVTTVTLGPDAPAQTIRGTPTSDTDGTRQATVIVDAGTSATLTLPNGTTMPLTTLSARITEFTVGPYGLAAMPGSLPPTSAYTYAAELSADEAIASGGIVTVDKPVSAYVENFLGFPVGTAVPLGQYDRTLANWVAQPDGRVIKVLSVTDGVATIDANGDGVAETDAAMTALGMTLAERQQLAQAYQPGATLMRTEFVRFFPHDPNYPRKALGVDPVVEATPSCASAARDIIKCDVRNATQSVAVPGTPLSLAYTSARTVGAADRTLKIPLIGATIPDNLLDIYVTVTVAGQTHTEKFTPKAGLTYDYTWDGKDAYGRPVQGNPTATVEVGMQYPIQYQIPAAVASSFGLPCTGTGTVQSCFLEQQTGVGDRHAVWRVSSTTTRMGGYDARAQGLGGFDFNVHHQYDPFGKVLYLGDGTTRVAEAITPTLTTVAGTVGSDYASGDGGPATKARIAYQPLHGFAALPDGRFLVTNPGYLRIVGTDGIINRFAGWSRSLINYSYGYQMMFNADGSVVGENGLKDSTYLPDPQMPYVGTDGTIFLADNYWANARRIMRIRPDGIMLRVAGNTLNGVPLAEGVHAHSAALAQITALAVDAQNNIYIATSAEPNRVYRLGADSVFHLFAGTGTWAPVTNGTQATRTGLGEVTALAFGPDGVLWVGLADNWNAPNRGLARITADGAIWSMIGAGSTPTRFTNDPKVARFETGINAIVVSPDNLVYFNDGNVILTLATDGILRAIAGNNPYPAAQNDEKGPAARAKISAITGLALLPDGSLLYADYWTARVRKIAASMPGYTGGAFIVASVDGNSLYVFDAAGRHLKTVNARTRVPVFTFEYDDAGRIISVRDAHGVKTTIERDALGTPVAIIAATGQRTALTEDGNGMLASIVAPDGYAKRFTYSASGALEAVSDQAGHTTQFTYDNGRLASTSDANGAMSTVATTSAAQSTIANFATASGVESTVAVEILPTGIRRSTTTLAGGQTISITSGPDGTQIIRDLDGTTTTLVSHPDPKLGMQAPLVDRTERLPSGLTRTTRTAAAVTFDDFDEIATITDSVIVNGRASVTTYDYAARTATLQSPGGRTRVTSFDDAGRLLRDSTSGLAATAYRYDELGRIAGYTRGQRTLAFGRDAQGHVTSVSAPMGQRDRFSFTPGGRTEMRISGSSDTTQFTYDQNGRVTGLTPPGRPAHEFGISAVGLLERYTAPAVDGLAPTTRIQYNGDGRPLVIIRPGGDSIVTVYDSLGRVSNTRTASGTDVFEYDLTSAKLRRITTPRGATLDLDTDGPLPIRSTWNGEVVGSVAATFDADMRRATQSVNGANPVGYTYDADGLLLTAGALSLTHSPLTGSTTQTVLGGVRTSLEYDALDVPVASASVYGTTELFTTRIERDSLGRIAKRTEVIQGATTVDEFSYSASGRLVSVQRDGDTLEIYDYDRNGNRIRAVTPWGTANATVDSQDRLIAYGNTQYRYNANGELALKITGTDSTTYLYSPLGALQETRLPDGTRIEYVIDGRGRRVGRKTEGILKKGWLYGEGLEIVAELNAENQVVSRFVYGERQNVPEYMIRGGETYRLLLDERGSVRLVVNVATGVIAQRLDYDSFGKVTRNSQPGFQPFGFAGGMYDDNSGLVRYGARDYDPSTGRWNTKDPLLFNGGANNLYQYAFGDPVNRVDISGFNSLSIAETEGTIVGGEALDAVLVSAAAMAFAIAHNSSIAISTDFRRSDDNDNVPPPPLVPLPTPAQPAGPDPDDIYRLMRECLEACNGRNKKATFCNSLYPFDRSLYAQCKDGVLSWNPRQWKNFCNRLDHLLH